MKQAVIAFLCMVVSAAAQDGAILEELVIDDCSAESAAKWSAAEAACTSGALHSKTGGNALNFHVDVNWKTGEKAYPIGWPRMTRQIPENVRDWSVYDYLQFSVYTTSSRTNLPAVPMGMSLYLPEKPHTYARTLSELEIGKWVDFRIPLQEIAGKNPCTGMQFHISESNYRDGDVLDFWIDRIVLTRYVRPFIAEAVLTEQTIISDSRNLEVEIAMFGLKNKPKIPVECTISSGEKVVFKGAIPVSHGRHGYSLPLPHAGLEQGVFDVTVSYDGRNVTAGSLRVIASPFEEGAK